MLLWHITNMAYFDVPAGSMQCTIYKCQSLHYDSFWEEYSHIEWLQQADRLVFEQPTRVQLSFWYTCGPIHIRPWQAGLYCMLQYAEEHCMRCLRIHIYSLSTKMTLQSIHRIVDHVHACSGQCSSLVLACVFYTPSFSNISDDCSAVLALGQVECVLEWC